MKYNNGDRVLVLDTCETPSLRGLAGNIRGYSSGLYFVSFGVHCNYFYYSLLEEELQLITPAKLWEWNEVYTGLWI